MKPKKKLKILVVDDKEVNLKSAKILLARHDLRLVDNCDEAFNLLKLREVKWEVIKQKFAEAGLPEDSDKLKGKAREQWWLKKHQIENENMRCENNWDVIFCDLLMPAGRKTMSEEGLKHLGQEMPVGFALALLAALGGAAKHIAVVTATNHHNHPASSWLDPLGDAYWASRPPNFIINGAKVGFYHAPFDNPFFVEGTTCPECKGEGEKQCWRCKGESKKSNGEPCGECNGTGKCPCWRCKGRGLDIGKRWGEILETLLFE